MSLSLRYDIIKSLQTTLPRGMPFDLNTLQQQGVSPQLAAKYVNSGWLIRLGQGVYAFAGDSLELHPTLCFLQNRVRGLHVAGKSALAMQGIRHNLMYREKITLWGDTRFSLPEWLTTRFPAHYVSAHLFDWPNSSPLPEQTLITPPSITAGLHVSVPERALLEMLYEVGTHQSMEEAYNLFTGVRNLRLNTLGPLLEVCTSIKTTRLLLTWGRETGAINIEQLQQQYHLSTGSNKRWIRYLDDGNLLSLKPHE